MICERSYHGNTAQEVPLSRNDAERTRPHCREEIANAKNVSSEKITPSTTKRNRIKLQVSAGTTMIIQVLPKTTCIKEKDKYSNTQSPP